MYSGDEVYDDDVTSGVGNNGYGRLGDGAAGRTGDPDDEHEHAPDDPALGFAGDPAREYPNRAVCVCGTVLMLTDEGWEPE